MDSPLRKPTWQSEINPQFTHLKNRNLGLFKQIMAITIATIVPAYNCETTLCRALDSILAQKRLPDEVIVVNDGSTDKTADIITDYSRRYSNIQGVTQKNSGPAIARNRGVRISTSDWVSFLDSDDYWFPHHLKNLVEIVEARPKLAWAAAPFCNEKSIKASQVFPELVTLNYLSFAHHKKNTVNTNTPIIRRSVFWECGGFREDWRNEEDKWLWFQIGLHYPNLGYSPVPSSMRTDRPNSLSKQNASYPEALAITINNTDQMIQSAENQSFFNRQDVLSYIGSRVSKILLLSLLISNSQYKQSLDRYRPFLSHVTLPLRTRIYSQLSFFRLPVLRIHVASIHLYRFLHKIIKTTTRHCSE